MAMDQGPWEVAVWIDTTDSTPIHYEFSNVNRQTLAAKMNKAVGKSGITNVLGTPMPARIKRFSIKKAK